MDRMTELQKRRLENQLNTCESMKRTFTQKKDKASANAFIGFVLGLIFGISTFLLD